jgi:glutaminyl-peptide cyclotransferase
MKYKKNVFWLLISNLLVVSGILSYWFLSNEKPILASGNFNGERAETDITTQVAFGPRIPGSTAHALTIQYIQDELQTAGWNSVVLEQEYKGKIAYNIMATRNSHGPSIMLGAHYDSRIVADADPIPSNRATPVPGANDGASGVAVLLEIARVLPKNSASTALLFIDIEDNGHLPGWEWIMGSSAFSENMSFTPKAVIIIDMIGDADLNIFMERNSDPEITAQIWQTAKNLGSDSTFIPEYKYQVLDDHLPFIEKGIQAVDIIDLDYPYWHTTMDTPDKISANSLKIVGDTLLAWIRDYGSCFDNPGCIK